MRWPLKPKLAVARSEDAEGASTEVSLVVADATWCFSQHVSSSVLMWFFVLLMLFFVGFCLGFWVSPFVRSSFLVLSCSWSSFLLFLGLQSFGCAASRDDALVGRRDVM